MPQRSSARLSRRHGWRIRKFAAQVDGGYERRSEHEGARPLREAYRIHSAGQSSRSQYRRREVGRRLRGGIGEVRRTACGIRQIGRASCRERGEEWGGGKGGEREGQ